MPIILSEAFLHPVNEIKIKINKSILDIIIDFYNQLTISNPLSQKPPLGGLGVKSVL